MALHSVTFAIIQTADWPKVDFSEIQETAPDTVRRSIDLSQFVVKYFSTPSFIVSGVVVPDQILSYSEVLILMASIAWTEAPPP
jgi:hypothetical protein